jgi:putative restriction endonuclease
MSLIAILRDPEWDAPFFKVLAPNDTGASSGHQAGIVIPKPLRQFFPELNPSDTGPKDPTVDNRILAELWVGEKHIATVDTRYQFQTWGGTRKPESRLTDNLGQLRNVAKGSDLLILQRHAIDLGRYRLMLVKKDNAQDFLKGRSSRWGTLEELPVTDQALSDATKELAAYEASPFAIFDTNAASVEIRSKRLARTIVFRKQLVQLYDNKCAVCRSALMTPSGRSELEGAHIVPRNLGGTNDARNGLGLCRQHHWAFDRGLFGIDEGRKILVPDCVGNLPANKSLKNFNGAPLLEATDRLLRAHEDALSWHRENTLIRDS